MAHTSLHVCFISRQKCSSGGQSGPAKPGIFIFDLGGVAYRLTILLAEQLRLTQCIKLAKLVYFSLHNERYNFTDIVKQLNGRK